MSRKKVAAAGPAAEQVSISADRGVPVVIRNLDIYWNYHATFPCICYQTVLSSCDSAIHDTFAKRFLLRVPGVPDFYEEVTVKSTWNGWFL